MTIAKQVTRYVINTYFEVQFEYKKVPILTAKLCLQVHTLIEAYALVTARFNKGSVFFDKSWTSLRVAEYSCRDGEFVCEYRYRIINIKRLVTVW